MADSEIPQVPSAIGAFMGSIATSMNVQTDDLVAYLVSETEHELKRRLDALQSDHAHLTNSRNDRRNAVLDGLKKQVEDDADVQAFAEAAKRLVGGEMEFASYLESPRGVFAAPVHARVDVSLVLTGDDGSFRILRREFDGPDVQELIRQDAADAQREVALRAAMLQLRQEIGDIPRMQRETRGLIARTRLVGMEGGEEFIEKVRLQIAAKYGEVLDAKPAS
jgi:hypothetical protein